MSTDDRPRGPRVRDVLAVFGALVAAAVVATGAGVLAGRARPSIALTARTSTVVMQPAVPVELEPAEVVADPIIRLTPPEILRTATITAAPWAPGLRLHRSVLATAWEGRRAEIEDRVSGDVRAYGIGDLLPHGSLLVGISTTAADIMVADSHLVRLHDDGRIEPLQDLTKAFEPTALPPGPDLDPDYEDQVRIAIIDLRDSNPTLVQESIDVLIAAGDPAVELLISHVESIMPVRSAEYAFPTGSGVEMRPRVAGEIVMMVLERITGQTFGDLQREDLTAEDRKAIARAWKRWWSGQ